jgi:hypothetical protein
VPFLVVNFLNHSAVNYSANNPFNLRIKFFYYFRAYRCSSVAKPLLFFNHSAENHSADNLFLSLFIPMGSTHFFIIIFYRFDIKENANLFWNFVVQEFVAKPDKYLFPK